MGRTAKILLGVAAAIAVVGSVGFKLYRDKLYVALPDYPPVKEARWLDQGWTADEQDRFHHIDQGTQTLNMPYEWFVALEQPRISLLGDVGRLNDPVYLDRYGFIPGAIHGGEVQLPIGFAKGENMRLPDGEFWLNPRTGEPMRALGFTCAACHTGRLTYRETALLVDGGPALTDLGKFRQGLGISILFTKYVPQRFDRFAMNVLGEDASEADKVKLEGQLDELWDRLNVIRKLDKTVEDKNLDEGYGRLDALNRIGNQVFGLDLGKEGRERNYVATTSPVSFPHIWSTHWFDWVQYNGSIEQPMVRNAGEALGVSAEVNLLGTKRELFDSGVQIGKLFKLETQLAGKQPTLETGFTGLRAPRWPADVLGDIKPEVATKGAAIYDGLCRGCHLPPVGDKAFWESRRWREPNKHGQRYLGVSMLPVEDIGTDPQQAKDMRDRKVWFPASLGLKSDNSFGNALGAMVERTVDRWYDKNGVKPDEEPEMNGFRENGIRAPLCYKARPLNGVWATPPFLHNGSVPSVFALLSPVEARPAKFRLGRREFDPVCLGYQMTAVGASPGDASACLDPTIGADDSQLSGLSEFDASKPGNRNTGHVFSDKAAPGVIGRALSAGDRLAVVEFLKTDCVNGAPPGSDSATSCAAIGYVAAPPAPEGHGAAPRCRFD